jgi:hypothetical protein
MADRKVDALATPDFSPGAGGDLSSNRHPALVYLFEHDLFGKPVSTFPDHALGISLSGKILVPIKSERGSNLLF